MRYMIGLIVLLFSTSGQLTAQSYAFGFKLGPTLASQNWQSGGSNNLLVAYHGMAFIESSPEDARRAFFAEAGYHIRGVSLRVSRSLLSPVDANFDRALKFQNVSLSLGAKSKFEVGALEGFYGFALRGEYTVDYDLDIYQGLDEGVNRFIGGITASGGIQKQLSELVAGFLELRFSPDVSTQIFIPSGTYTSPFTSAQIPIRENNIRNVSIELSVGIRFLHKIVYVN